MGSPFELRRAKIVRVVEENPRTRRFLLQVENFPPFRPGQFNMLYVYAQGEVPISISSIRKDLLEHTVRFAGEVTEDLFRLGEGDFIGVRGPYGSCFPLEECIGMDILLVAGGLGLAEIKPALEYILEHRERYGRVYLLIGAKDPSGLLYREEHPGWSEPLVDARRLEDLPAPARAYLDRISELAGAPVALVSVGPDREQTIIAPDGLLAALG